MTDARVLELIAAYGADPDRWPADERDDALARAAASPAAQQALHDARMLDQALATWSNPQPRLDAVARVLAAARTAPRHQPLRWPWFAGSGLAAAAALVGIVLLTGQPRPAPAPQAGDARLQAALDSDAMALIYTPLDSLDDNGIY